MNATGEYPLKYARVILGQAMPLVLALALITNLLVVLVLTRRHMRTPTNTVLVVIAMLDIGTSVAPAPWYVYNYALGNYNTPLFPPIVCYAHYAMTDVLPTMLHTASIWLLLLLAGQRYIHVCRPAIAHKWCTVSCVKRATVAILVMAFLLQFARFFDTVFKPTLVKHENEFKNACRDEMAGWVGRIGDNYYNFTYYTFRVVFVLIIPCLALLVLNALLIQALRRYNAEHARPRQGRGLELTGAVAERDGGRPNNLAGGLSAELGGQSAINRRLTSTDLDFRHGAHVTMARDGALAPTTAGRPAPRPGEPGAEARCQEKPIGDATSIATVTAATAAATSSSSSSGSSGSSSSGSSGSSSSNYLPASEAARPCYATHVAQSRPSVSSGATKVGPDAQGTGAGCRRGTQSACVQPVAWANPSSMGAAGNCNNRSQSARQIPGGSRWPHGLVVPPAGASGQTDRPWSAGLAEGAGRVTLAVPARSSSVGVGVGVGVGSIGASVGAAGARPARRLSRMTTNNRTTMMLVMFLTVFLLIEVPVAGVTVAGIIMNSSGMFHQVDLDNILRHVKLFADFSIMLSYPVNFAIYFSMSTRFRSTLCDVLSRRRRHALQEIVTA